MKVSIERYREYLIDLLKEDLVSKEAEIEALRHSLRYRVGGWVLEAWPPSHRTLVTISRLMVALTRIQKRSGSAVLSISKSTSSFSSVGMVADIIVFGSHVPRPYAGENAACTDDPSALTEVLDSNRPPGTLIIGLLDQALTRRVQRLRLCGWRLVWWPEEFIKADESSQGRYLAAHADECRFGKFS